MFQMAYNTKGKITGRICHFHLAGGCNKDAICPFLHPSPPLGSDGSLIVCRYDKLPNGCRNVAKCLFAHGEQSTNKPRWQKRKLRKNKVAKQSQSQASIPEKVVRPSPSPMLDLQLPDPSPVLKPAPAKRPSPSASDERSSQKRLKPNNSLQDRDSGDIPVFNNDEQVKVKQLEHKVKLLAQDKANLAQKVLKLELDNAKLQSQLEVVILPSYEDVKSLQTLEEERKILIDENQKTILRKDSEIKELKININNFKERLEAEDIELKNNQNDIEALDKEKGELVERLAADEREISRLSENLREMENERDELDTENVNLKNQLNNILPEPGWKNMQQRIQELERQKTQSEEKLKENDERLTHVLKEKDDLSNQLIGMEKERDDLDIENSDLQAELNQKNKEINLLKAGLNV